ncbi:MAG: polyprenyl synthetase family protein [Streptococcaceae bacterium]|jgi:heptaprenyl diphosphate synthase|nr:polyprenyl synthetase family protein [Streptococcaceae bacterium]
MFDFWMENRDMMRQLETVQNIMDTRLEIDDPEIREAIKHFAENGGKMVRPALFLLFSQLGNAGQSGDPRIAASLELLHLATLIHDDIIDDADTRRKQPTVQAQLGKDTAVYAGDFIYTVYFELLVETMAGTPFLARNAASMKKILNGELTQKALMYQTDCTREQYMQAIAGKTAELLSLACEEGAYFGGLDEENVLRARQIGEHIGLAFQIYDDVLNFSLDFVNEKPILTDVTQGIYTLPLLIARDKEPAVISKYLESPQALTKPELIELAEFVKSCGALDEAISEATHLTNLALSDIAHLPDTTSRKILTEVTNKLLKRQF